MVAAMIRTIFAPTRSGHGPRRIRRDRRDAHLAVLEGRDHAPRHRRRLLAFTSFPPGYWKKIWSTPAGAAERTTTRSSQSRCVTQTSDVWLSADSASMQPDHPRTRSSHATSDKADVPTRNLTMSPVPRPSDIAPAATARRTSTCGRLRGSHPP